MNVLFLDYDGVVNIPAWYFDDVQKKWKCRYNHPGDNKVNGVQAVQWVSEFCEKYNYVIVVTSTWRWDDNYIDCLKNGGLRPSVEVIGKTPRLDDKCRGDEIQEWLDQHPDVHEFIILDDDSDMGLLLPHLVQTNSGDGFTMDKFTEAKNLRESLYGDKK